MNASHSLLLALGLASGLAAQAPTVQISIGVREVGANGQPFTNIGDNGGSSGAIEWINLDGQTLTLDGTWQQFTFDVANDPVTFFAGVTTGGVDGAIDGTHGTLEHIRILNTGGATDEIAFFVDDIANTITVNGQAQTTTFGTFDGYADDQEVMFQEPSFSGSTAGNVLLGPLSGVDNYVASRSESCRFNVQFVDNSPTRWVRMTTFNTTTQPNPMVRFDQGSIISFWMRGGVSQDNLGSQGPGTAIAELHGEGLSTGESSTYVCSGLTPSIVGAFAVSIDGGTDFPILGGNLVSFSNNITAAGVSADMNGVFSLPIPGAANQTNLVFQSVFFDPSTANNLTFSNAVLAEYGL